MTAKEEYESLTPDEREQLARLSIPERELRWMNAANIRRRCIEVLNRGDTEDAE